MSFIITMCVREGIVMAGDSRLTFSRNEPSGDKTISHIAIGLSDSNQKVFLSPSGIGISTAGQADINGVPIAGFIDSYIRDSLSEGNDIDSVPDSLLSYFSHFSPIPRAYFHIAGYKSVNNSLEQHVWELSLFDKRRKIINDPSQQGASWGGEGDIFARIINPAFSVSDTGLPAQAHPFFPIPFNFYTLQDAIDFCIFAVRTTAEAHRFQPRPKTVGGPIDVLVIKPENAFWIQKKELHA